MIRFLRHFLETVAKEPNRAAVVDWDGARATSYRQLFSCCLRVNAWLRAHGLGREICEERILPVSHEKGTLVCQGKIRLV